MLVNVVLVKREFTKAVTIGKHATVELDDLTIEMSLRQLEILRSLIEWAQSNPGKRMELAN